MTASSIPQKIDLTHPKSVQTLVENRRIFNLKHCEMNVFESYQQAFDVPLSFSDLVITSMLRGKKIMQLFNDDPFDYLPGESVIVPANETMRIHFPEAEEQNPSQCIALAVPQEQLHQTLHYLNERYRKPDEGSSWKIAFNKYHFENDGEVTALINKLMRVSMSNDTAKDIYADLSLKELLIRLVQSQHLHQVENESVIDGNSSRLHYVLNYIKTHLSEKITVEQLSKMAYVNRNLFFKLFKEQFGVTPIEYINQEKIRMAKQLLANSSLSLSDISWQCGFSDVNYFSRTFRKYEGMSPKQYEAKKFNSQLLL
jgi:YesN/AraC family two-component response regulator